MLLLYTRYESYWRAARPPAAPGVALAAVPAAALSFGPLPPQSRATRPRSLHHCCSPVAPSSTPSFGCASLSTGARCRAQIVVADCSPPGNRRGRSSRAGAACDAAGAGSGGPRADAGTGQRGSGVAGEGPRAWAAVRGRSAGDGVARDGRRGWCRLHEGITDCNTTD